MAEWPTIDNNRDWLFLDLSSGTNVRLVGVPLCPDLLRYELLGAADGWRGRAVRGFFWLLRGWPV